MAYRRPSTNGVKNTLFNSIWFSNAVKRATVEYSSNNVTRLGANTHTQIRIELEGTDNKGKTN